MRYAARSAAIALALAIVAPLAVVAGLFSRRKAMRSLWVVHPIPTVPAKADAERMLGTRVTTWAFERGRLEHRFDRVLRDDRRRLGPAAPFLAFIHACARFDRLHFYCDRGLLPIFAPRRFNPLELRIYRLLGKQVYFWAYGADVRTQPETRALGEPNACTLCPEPGRFCICDTRAGGRNQRRIAASATAVFSIGDLKAYTPGSVNDLFYWPLSLDDHRYTPVYPSAEPAPLRVVHAPNHRHFKGTDHLIAAVDALRAGGVSLELDLVEGLTNDDALDRYRAADVVFDQCLIGFHGFFALEAMALGKPVLCFIRDPQGDLLAPLECPIINIKPDTIADALGSLAADRARLTALGRRGRAYVERYYSVEAFAARYRNALDRLGVKI